MECLRVGNKRKSKGKRMITITCRSCGEQTEVPDSLAGENEKCPKCGRLVEVPTLSSLLGLPASDALVNKHLPPNPP